MLSLRDLLNNHTSLLVIDAASSLIQTGWLSDRAESRWASAETDAGTGIFTCIEQLEINPTQVAAAVFCEGPGSILGIRTAAMAIRSWNLLSSRPVYTYQSLALVSAALKRPAISVIADARRERWHCQSQNSPIRQLPVGSLAGELVIPEGFRHWSQLPEGTAKTSYDLSRLLPAITETNLFSLTDDPDAYLHAEPSYKEWTPQIHRAP